MGRGSQWQTAPVGDNSVQGVGRLGPVDRRDVLAIWSPFNNQKGRYLGVAHFVTMFFMIQKLQCIRGWLSQMRVHVSTFFTTVFKFYTSISTYTSTSDGIIKVKEYVCNLHSPPSVAICLQLFKHLFSKVFKFYTCISDGINKVKEYVCNGKVICIHLHLLQFFFCNNFHISFQKFLSFTPPAMMVLSR